MTPNLHFSTTTGRRWPRLIAILVLAAALPAVAQRAALTQNIDEPGRNPFTIALNGVQFNNYFSSFTVPAGKRYVIDTYTASCSIVTGHSLSGIQLLGTTTGVRNLLTTTAHYVQPNGSISGAAVNYYQGTGAGPFYADPGTLVTISVGDDTGGTSVKDCAFNISGHVIVLP